MHNKLVYVIEDERDLCDMICRKMGEYQLNAQGFYTGGSVLRQLPKQRPDVCIVDLMLPDMDGLEVVRKLSADPGIGVIVLTGRGDLSDRVLGLEMGADDYLVKPFEPRELVARTHSLLRRLEALSQVGTGKPRRFASFAGRTYDTDCLSVQWPDGRSETLSASEALLLSRFLRAPRKVLSREQLFDDEVDCDRRPFDRSIDIRVSRLRRKIEVDPQNPHIIKTVYGAGYLLASAVEWLDG